MTDGPRGALLRIHSSPLLNTVLEDQTTNDLVLPVEIGLFAKKAKDNVRWLKEGIHVLAGMSEGKERFENGQA